MCNMAMNELKRHILASGYTFLSQDSAQYISENLRSNGLWSINNKRTSHKNCWVFVYKASVHIGGYQTGLIHEEGFIDNLGSAGFPQFDDLGSAIEWTQEKVKEMAKWRDPLDSL